MLPLRRLRPLPGRFRKAAKEATSPLVASQQQSPPYHHATNTRSISGSYSTTAFFRPDKLPPTQQFGFSFKNHQRLHHHVTSKLFSASTKQEEYPTNIVTTQGTEVVSPIPSSSSSPQRDEIVELLQADTKGTTDKAVRLLSEMIRQYDANSTGGERPDNTLYEAVLESLVRHGTATGDHKATALQAQTIVTEMKQLYQSSSSNAKDSELRPSTICFSHLIAAWSRVPSLEPTVRAFWDMLEPKNLAPSPSSPSTTISSKLLRAHLGQSLNRVLKTIATSGVPDAGKRCDKLFDKLGSMSFPSGITLSPNPESFHFLIQAWQATVENTTVGETLMKSPKDMVNAARRIEGLLKFMIQRYEATNKQNSEWLPKPDMYLWLIKAYGYAGAPDRTQKLLQQLIEEQDRVFKIGGNNIDTDTLPRMPPPTTAMYNYVLETWARQGKPGEAARLLSQWVSRCSHADNNNSQQEVCRPDLDSCHLVIRAWGQFADYQNAPKAELILNRMKASATSKDKSVLPTPTVETYNAVLEAWSRHRNNHKIAKAVTNTDRILEEMVQLVQGSEGGHIKYHPCSPNSRTYELVLETYARFGYKLFHRKKKSAKLLRQMKHFGITPTERSLVLVEICQEDGKSLDDVEAEEQGLL